MMACLISTMVSSLTRELLRNAFSFCEDVGFLDLQNGFLLLTSFELWLEKMTSMQPGIKIF